MDDLAHEALPFQSLRRKRKADPDDCQPQDAPSDAPSCEPMLIDSSATPRCPSKRTDRPPAPSWLLPDADHAIVSSWPEHPPSSSMAYMSGSHKDSPSRPKRPRIEIPQPTPASPRRLRRARGLYSHAVPSPRRYVRRARAGETRDTGIVSATEPGPSRGSLLRVNSLPSTPRHTSSLPVSPVDPISPHIPPHQPPVNRETLKELDLEAILRNPQLRHDLLFDSGLQFRPTSSRRKRDMADNYWLAIVRELETGCTCFTIDAHGRPCERICVCSTPHIPTGRPIYAVALDHRTTVRVASRIRPLLLELLEVLVSIIQPVMAKSPGFCVQPTSLHSQFQQNLTHVAQLREVLDADLIQQELDHGLFDPSGVFQTIGDIIRCHCAPMRDHAVDQMVALARSCAPGGNGSKVDAVRAIRLCFEIMELMKLDVANHQLQTLRPYLVQSAAQYELKTFQESRQGGHLSLAVTREWLQSAHREVARRAEMSGLCSLSAGDGYTKLPHRTQIQIAATSAIVDLVFNPPSPPPASPACSPLPSTPRTTPTVTLFAGYPETLYLDHGRLMTLTTDAADFTALYMLLMLYRQLVFSGCSVQGDAARTNVKLDELLKLKKEIWDIGPPHLGLCFQGARRTASHKEAGERLEGKTDAEWAKWHNDISNVVLQVAMRATDARQRTSAGASSSCSAHDIRTPDEQTIKLASSWTESNLRHEAPLSMLMRKRIREQVLEAAVEIMVPSLKKGGLPAEGGVQQEPGAASGLEPLMPEIRHLAERLAKLASIHLNVYGALYAQPGFVAD
ncbi:uncharacterized protein FIBRA_05679 [Fibroporia radiculosa]|uniref:Tcp11-domain-containing protein n=1 Tax=Fibroporia radiculosa TaxID=599839 RepID=J4GRF5_9APHY|nr:uncharacterized protein FIBRA_05679 [Fibroporia radiculosa]CCM03545.1 predicted protein [Fibroporia radiculosa]